MDDPTTRRDFLSLWGGGALAALTLGRRARAAERSPVTKPPRLRAGETLTFENPSDPGEYLVQVDDRIRTLTPGKARGRLLGGNLTVLAGIVGSGYLPDFSGHVLFLEDVDEDVYRVDRMLTQLRLAGILDQITGFVFGRCTRCRPDSTYGSFTLEEVLTQHVAPLGIPAWHGARIGHVPDPFTVPLGVEVEVDAEAGTIAMLEPAVA